MNERQDMTSAPRKRRAMDRDESATAAVVEAVATAEGVEPDALPPLAARVDPDALNSLFATRTPSPAAGLVFMRTADIPSDVELGFRYAGYDVTVTENYVALE